MRQVSIVSLSTLALVVVCVALSLVVAIELLYPTKIETSDPVPDEHAVAMVPTFNPAVYMPPKMNDLTDLLDRPLFFTDRRFPPAPEPAATPVAAPTPLRLVLEGVAITADSRVAVLRDLDNNQLLQLTEDMSHEGWILDEVSASGATFKRGAQVEELVLEPGNGSRRRR
ncbi:MAG: hypothetical protein OEO71_05640 [Gammaproteobacteria bacterium]|nr:hypothetical protein [Gammaproteobacteria bacterium]